LYTHQPPPPPTYPLSLHDALPISDRAEREHAEHAHGDVKGHARIRFLELRLEHLSCRRTVRRSGIGFGRGLRPWRRRCLWRGRRSEEHTSELQSRFDLVCRLLLEK